MLILLAAVATLPAPASHAQDVDVSMGELTSQCRRLAGTVKQFPDGRWRCVLGSNAEEMVRRENCRLSNNAFPECKGLAGKARERPAKRPDTATDTALKPPSPVLQDDSKSRPASLFQSAGAEGRRVALVIGNSAYGSVERLANPASDARAIAASFRRLGFAEVVERYDLSLAALVDTLKAFGDKAADADWAIVYYAGHGIEMGGITYLIPTDARLLRDIHVIDEALPLERVLAKVELARKLRLVILDACRNNPFAVRMAHAAGSGRSIGRGLARIEPEGGVIVAYAAKHGTIAQDGEAAHSPFTEALLHHLEEPDLEINFLFRKVRDRVLTRTGGAQEPFVYGSLGSELLYFKVSARQ